MAEVYTCICKGQKFTINENGIICCSNCARMNFLRFQKNGLESPKDFNKRIREEEYGEFKKKQEKEGE